MVNAGRVACIFTPFALSIASLVCIIFLFLGGTSQHNKTLDAFYFFKIDLTNLTLTPDANLLSAVGGDNGALEDALKAAKQALDLKDYYTIYLWNYCAWNGKDEYAYCSPKKAKFWFNPIEVWGLNSTGLDDVPKSLKDGLHTYEAVSKYMFVVYAMALVASVLVILIGISALFSRWGSFITTFFASAAATASLAASIIATALFYGVKGTFNTVFKEYDIKGDVGRHMLNTTWLAVLFSLGAAFFWLLSVCCCSGRSPYKTGRDSRRVKVEKTPYTYERVGSPYLGPRDSQAVPLTTMHAPQQQQKAAAYEPFRAQQV